MRRPLDYLKTFQLVVSVHNELRPVPVHPDQDHVLWTVVHVAAHQLVGGSIGEELQEEEKEAYKFPFLLSLNVETKK